MKPELPYTDKIHIKTWAWKEKEVSFGWLVVDFWGSFFPLFSIPIEGVNYGQQLQPFNEIDILIFHIFLLLLSHLSYFKSTAHDS